VNYGFDSMDSQQQLSKKNIIYQTNDFYLYSLFVLLPPFWSFPNNNKPKNTS